MRAISLIAILVAGMALGWAVAHKVIAVDCEQLGAFFDGKKIRRCAAAEPGGIPHGSNYEPT